MNRIASISAALALGLALVAPAQAKPEAAPTAHQAQGTPQRSTTPPPGLLQVLQREVRGIANALIRTEGSNSRLQDLPDSP